jgi:predicted aspartyl protease
MTKISINGISNFNFIIDTAAQNSSLFMNTIDKLELRPLDNSYTYVQGANGNRRANIYKIDKLSVGEAHKNELIIAVLPETEDSKIGDGILGLDFLSNYGLEFNNQTQHFCLHPFGDDWEKIKQSGEQVKLGRIFGNILTVDAIIDEIPVKALLDTGARRNLINWKAAQMIGMIDRADPRLEPDEPIIGATGAKLNDIVKFSPSSISLGSQKWTEQSATVADISIFKLAGWSDSPSAILGARLLENRHFLIDYKNLNLVIIADN